MLGTESGVFRHRCSERLALTELGKAGAPRRTALSPHLSSFKAGWAVMGAETEPEVRPSQEKGDRGGLASRELGEGVCKQDAGQECMEAQPSPGPAPAGWSETGQPAAGRGLICAQPSPALHQTEEQNRAWGDKGCS